jgi:hypothetical protein
MALTTALVVSVVAVAMQAGTTGPTTKPTSQAAPWDVASFPDEAGFKRRVARSLELIAARDFGTKQMAVSKCPDTGQTVRSWALEGEDVYSPFTGRKYKQGETGYFGPKARDEQGRISAFGGDPLKQDLPPAAARMLLGRDVDRVKWYLSIPGNLRQQYHFAAVNWGRFYPLLAKEMSPEWRKAFADAVASYREDRRPSDGAAREHGKPLSTWHDYVGEEGELLGGNVQDGGTENHKTMWRTSGLLWSQLIDDGAVSLYPAPEARRRCDAALRGFLRTCLTVGNGEYDSSIYYSHALNGYLNLFDFSPDPRTRDLAHAQLDFYFATYGLKMLNGTFVGAQKRGFADGFKHGEMDLMAWMYTGHGTLAVGDDVATNLQQATTAYRPNRVLTNILTKNVALPFEARMARPTYHSKDRNAFQELFWCDDSLALGSVQMTMVDNPNQQTVWSLGVRGPDGTRVLGGGQPRHRSPEGHTPYTQVFQHQGSIVVLTAPTLRTRQRAEEFASRAANAAEALTALPANLSIEERWAQAPKAAETWLFVPRAVKTVSDDGRTIVLDAGDAWVGVQVIQPPQGDANAVKPFWIDERRPNAEDRKLRDTLDRYRILVVPGAVSGYAIDTAPKSRVASAADFAKSLTAPKLDQLDTDPRVTHRTPAGATLTMEHVTRGLRCRGSVNGAAVDWSAWAGGAVYDSPYVKIKDGRMTVTDGRETYALDATGADVVWR